MFKLNREIPAVLCVSALVLAAGCAETDNGAVAEPAAATTEEQPRQTERVEQAEADVTAPRRPSDDVRAQISADLDDTDPLARTQRRTPEVEQTGEVMIVAEPAVLNLGTMATGETVRGTVTLTNTGDEPRRVMDSRTSCGCTVANVPKGQVLEPGESVDVEVSLRGGNRPEQMNKTVTFIVENQPPQRVQVQGETFAYVTIEPHIIDPDRLPDGKVVLQAQDEQPFRITAMHPRIATDLPEGTATNHTVTIDWDRWEESGQPRRLLFYIDHPKTSQLTSTIRVPARRVTQATDDVATRQQARQRQPVVRNAADLIKRGDTEAVLAMIDQDGFNVEATDQTGMTLLAVAAKEGNVELVQALIDAGADIEAPDRVGRTPLMQAAQSKNVDAVRTLLQVGADVSQRDHTLGNTALSWAAGFGDSDSVRELLDAGAEVDVVGNITGFTPLIWAAGFGEAESVRLLVDAGANVEIIDMVQQMTPIMHAARTGRSDNVRVLAEANANLEATDPTGRTVLLLAAGASGADAATVKALIDAGADLSAVDRNGLNALKHAQSRADARGEEVVATLKPLFNEP